MYKKIIFCLIIFINIINSMNHQNILTNISSDKDILWAFTERLCIGNNQATNNYQFFKGKKNIFHSLLRLNTTFYAYYSNENIQKKIVDYFANQRYLSTLTIAQHLHFPKIGKKIIDLHEKASKKDMQFSEEDLAENNSWYLNSTIDKNLILGHHYCLLSCAIWAIEIKKVEILINNTSFVSEVLPLQCVIRRRRHYDDIHNKQELTDLFSIFSSLLTHVSPDHRHNVQEYTALMLAAATNEKAIAQLLLERGGNPFLLYYYFTNKIYSITDTYDHIKNIPHHSGLENAFTLERGEPKGWLMDIYNEIQKKKG